MQLQTSRDWFEASYSEMGFAAQRLYPNEDLCRFFGREFFNKIPREQRGGIRVLELGCGSCANLWMIAKEGFAAYGLDISPSSLALGRRMLAHWGVDADLREGNMQELPYADNTFDVVVDVLAAFSMPVQEYRKCLSEVFRVMKPGGKFFSFLLSSASDAFTNHAPAVKLDEWTLNGILRNTSPYSGSRFPCRFQSQEFSRALYEEAGFAVTWLETVGRTYRTGQEYFEYISICGQRPEA